MKALRSAVIGFAALVGGLFAATSASAGGWAVINFDQTPALTAGESTEVGFTLLRHGHTPESSTDMTFVLLGEGGRFVFTPVPNEDVVGHHTVLLDVPTSGSYELTVYGQFMALELGTFEVKAASVTAATTGSSAGWTIAVWGSATLAVLLAAIVVVDMMRRRPVPVGETPVTTSGDLPSALV